MNSLLHPAPASRRIALHSDEHWTVTGLDARVSIRCLRGVVWITTEGNIQDVILRAGDEWRPASRDLTVVGALSDSELRIDRAA